MSRSRGLGGAPPVRPSCAPRVSRAAGMRGPPRPQPLIACCPPRRPHKQSSSDDDASVVVEEEEAEAAAAPLAKTSRLTKPPPKKRAKRASDASGGAVVRRQSVPGSLGARREGAHRTAGAHLLTAALPVWHPLLPCSRSARPPRPRRRRPCSACRVSERRPRSAVGAEPQPLPLAHAQCQLIHSRLAPHPCCSSPLVPLPRPRPPRRPKRAGGGGGGGRCGRHAALQCRVPASLHGGGALCRPRARRAPQPRPQGAPRRCCSAGAAVAWISHAAPALSRALAPHGTFSRHPPARSASPLPVPPQPTPRGHPDCLTNKTFVVTGVHDSLLRGEVEDLVKRHGGKVRA